MNQSGSTISLSRFLISWYMCHRTGEYGRSACMLPMIDNHNEQFLFCFLMCRQSKTVDQCFLLLPTCGEIHTQLCIKDNKIERSLRKMAVILRIFMYFVTCNFDDFILFLILEFMKTIGSREKPVLTEIVPGQRKYTIIFRFESQVSCTFLPRRSLGNIIKLCPYLLQL